MDRCALPTGCRRTLLTRLQEGTLSGLMEVGAGAACLWGEDGAPGLMGCSPVPEMGSDSSGTAAHECGPSTCPGPSDADLWHSLLRGVCCPRSSIQLPAWLPISAEDI